MFRKAVIACSAMAGFFAARSAAKAALDKIEPIAMTEHQIVTARNKDHLVG